MDSSSFEVRMISRAAAALLALIVGVLVATVRVPPAPAPGVGETASVMIVRRKAEDDAAMAAAEALAANADPAPFASARDGEGFGEEIVLWVNGPGGEIVFRNADRYRRCVTARHRKVDTADCPSAADQRRMMLDEASAARDA